MCHPFAHHYTLPICYNVERTGGTGGDDSMNHPFTQHTMIPVRRIHMILAASNNLLPAIDRTLTVVLPSPAFSRSVVKTLSLYDPAEGEARPWRPPPRGPRGRSGTSSNVPGDVAEASAMPPRREDGGGVTAAAAEDDGGGGAEEGGRPPPITSS